MDRHPTVARRPLNKVSARQRHEKHQYRPDADGDARVVASRRRRPGTAVFLAISTAITSRRRFLSAAFTNVFDDDLDFVENGCSRHDFTFPVQRSFQATCSPRYKYSKQNPFVTLGPRGREMLRHKILSAPPTTVFASSTM